MTLPTERREFLKYLGAGFAGVAASSTGPLGPIVEAQGPMPFQGVTVGSGAGFLSFEPIVPTDRDDLVLPKGFRYATVIAYGDQFTSAGERFGFNNDFTAFLPLNPSVTEGLLWVNHEYVGTEADNYGEGFRAAVGGVPNLQDYKFDVGGSVVHLYLSSGGNWYVKKYSPLNRRLTADSLVVADGPALQGLSSVGGTLANCSGCLTPWDTILTCEENYQDYVPEDLVNNGQGTVGGPFGKNGTHFGWVVEVDIRNPQSVPVKHTWLGRFRHENVSLRTAAGEAVIAYMGDDRTNGHVYKFISASRYTPGSGANQQLLSSGRLFSARFNADGTGQWIELATGTALNPYPGAAVPAVPSGATTLGAVYGTQGNILIDAYRASNLAGSTPTGRPEDVEVHPVDKSVYIAFTANATAQNSLFNNIYGELVRIVEGSGDGQGSTFTWQRWKAGGPNEAAQAGSVFAAPDNLSFDKAANLWVVTDISSANLNGANPNYTAFKNNGFFFIPTSGGDAGRAFQFASGPCECELTGPSWTPDEKTLFLSIQHPGEVNGRRLSNTFAPKGSNWPYREHGAPLPAVVQIQRD